MAGLSPYDMQQLLEEMRSAPSADPRDYTPSGHYMGNSRLPPSGAPPFGGRPPVPMPRPPALGMPSMSGGDPVGQFAPRPAPQLGSLIGQQPGGMGGPGGITATPLPPPGQPQPPMMPATPMGGPMATGGTTGAPGSAWGGLQPMPGASQGALAQAMGGPQPMQQARQGIQMGQGGQSFGQSRYLMDFLARMFGGGR